MSNHRKKATADIWFRDWGKFGTRPCEFHDPIPDQHGGASEGRALDDKRDDTDDSAVEISFEWVFCKQELCKQLEKGIPDRGPGYVVFKCFN